MPIVVNTNSAATSASFNLSKANDALRKSLARLSSGNRITNPAEDAGGLAVAYKLDSHANEPRPYLTITRMLSLFYSFRMVHFKLWEKSSVEWQSFGPWPRM